MKCRKCGDCKYHIYLKDRGYYIGTCGRNFKGRQQLTRVMPEDNEITEKWLEVNKWCTPEDMKEIFDE